MQGAREYANLFQTGQLGRLYVVSGEHARGKTFRIFVLPAGEQAIPNGSGNPPLNRDAVEVYGVIRGQRGWSEVYGWIHEGKWKEDFLAIADAMRTAEANRQDQYAKIEQDKEQNTIARTAELLASY